MHSSKVISVSIQCNLFPCKKIKSSDLQIHKIEGTASVENVKIEKINTTEPAVDWGLQPAKAGNELRRRWVFEREWTEIAGGLPIYNKTSAECSVVTVIRWWDTSRVLIGWWCCDRNFLVSLCFMRGVLLLVWLCLNIHVGDYFCSLSLLSYYFLYVYLTLLFSPFSLYLSFHSLTLTLNLLLYLNIH